MSNKVKILSTIQIQQKLNRLAYEVYENNFSEKEILVVGIDGNGYKVAVELTNKLKEISNLKINLGKIKINKDKPWQNNPVIDIDEKAFVNKTIILVDRSHTNFPVKADFVGLRLSTTLQEHIEADFSKKGKEAVYLT